MIRISILFVLFLSLALSEEGQKDKALILIINDFSSVVDKANAKANDSIEKAKADCHAAISKAQDKVINDLKRLVKKTS